MSSIHVFGIRHHGPGCARSLRAALEELQPDIVLVEGPPDAQEVLPLLTHQDMQPPVALLIYAPDQPKRAVYYPFTSFSPEWQAMQFAYTRQIPARFMDLPQAIQLAKLSVEEEQPVSVEEEQTPTATQTGTSQTANATVQEEQAPPEKPTIREDPLALLAEAAGYTDHELWWEQNIEQRQNSVDLFAGILEAMTALRADPTPKDEEEAQREAHMRQSIRTAQKEGFKRIAVVCGAWHAPVLVNPGPAKEDKALLDKLKKIKVEATWIPWTNSRLAYRSGYGAGVTSPGWYEHLWSTSEGITTRWMTRAAHLLRTQGLDASSASVIEAVRLSETLAALRDLPMPGLAEQHEAITTVLCNGNETPMQLIREQLEIGERLGQVPAEAPAVPIQRDLEAKQKQLRLKPSVERTTLELDLRKEGDRARSRLLHRLRLLSIEWGKIQRVRGKQGTFHEHWHMQWQVEFVIALIEANIWGNTIEAAANAYLHDAASTTADLPKLTELLDGAILAELPDAIEHLLQAIQKRAAMSADVQHLMNALPPLARVARYGNVRQTRTENISAIIQGLFERIVIGLPGACASLDDDAASSMVKSIDHVYESVKLLDLTDLSQEWYSTLQGLTERDNIHGLVRGRACRILLDNQVLSQEELQRQANLALSPAQPATQAASWIEGVLYGSGLTLIHHDGLWRTLDLWLGELTPDVFTALLPILRRSFANFQAPERRKMSEKVKHIRTTTGTHAGSTGAQGADNALNQENANLVLPVLAQIIGASYGR